MFHVEHSGSTGSFKVLRGLQGPRGPLGPLGPSGSAGSTVAFRGHGILQGPQGSQGPSRVHGVLEVHGVLLVHGVPKFLVVLRSVVLGTSWFFLGASWGSICFSGAPAALLGLWVHRAPSDHQGSLGFLWSMRVHGGPGLLDVPDVPSGSLQGPFGASLKASKRSVDGSSISPPLRDPKDHEDP